MRPRIAVNAAAIRGGGPETFISEMLPELALLMKEAEFFVAVSRPRRHLYDRLPGNCIVETVHEAVVEGALRRLLWETQGLACWLRDKRPALYIRADETCNLGEAITRVPMIVTWHTMAYLETPEALAEGRVAAGYQRAVRRLAARRADVIVAVSQDEAERLRQAYPEAAEKVVVVWHGVNVERFRRRAGSETRAAAGMQREARYILAVGDRHPHKNLPSLIAGVLAYRRKTGRLLQLVIVGRPRVSREEQRLAAAMAADEGGQAIVLESYRNGEELTALYAGACAFVSASTYESFGMTVLEAMAAGVPVAAAATAVSREICGDAAVYFDPGESESVAAALERVVDDEMTRERLCREGAARCQQFTWPRAAAAYKSICEGLLGG